MKLWVLRPIEFPDGSKSNPWEPWYDKAFGFIVRAEHEQQARQLADDEAGEENGEESHPWLNANYSTCQELLPDGVAEVVMRDFNAA